MRKILRLRIKKMAVKGKVKDEEYEMVPLQTAFV